jgi:hypothetical protein
VLESFFQFEAAAADKLEIFTEQTNFGGAFHAGSGLLDLMTVDQHFTGEDQRLGALSGSGQAALQQQFIEPRFQN